MALLNFKYGAQAGLASQAFDAGTVYVTNDTKKLFVDNPNGTSGRICLGDFQLVEYSSGTAETALNNYSLKETNVLYLALNTSNGATALYRYNGTGFSAISNTEEIAAIQGDISGLKTDVNDLKTFKNTTVPNTYMPFAGGQFTGDVSFKSGEYLTVNAPRDGEAGKDDAAPRQYVDGAESRIMGSASGTTTSGATVYDVKRLAQSALDKANAADATADAAMPKAGGEFTGDVSFKAGEYLTINTPRSDDSGKMDAATRDYVDTAKTNAISTAANDATNKANAILGTSSDSADKNTVYGAKAAAAAAQTTASNAMPKTGGTFTGNVSFGSGKTLSVNTPTADAHAATKKYVDEAKSGAIATAADDATNKANAVLGTSTDGTTANTVYGAKAAAAEALAAANNAKDNANGRVAKAGDAMTGFLTLHAAPTADMHAATKKYVDEAKSSAISTLKGTSSDAATAETIYGAKKYTDDKVSDVSTALSTLEGKIGNLSNIMNFVGTTTTEIVDGTTTSIAKPTGIASDVTYTPAAGDVVVDKNGKECVFDGSKWCFIGDVSAQDTAIENLDKRLTTAEGNITGLREDVGTDDGKGALFTRMATLEAWKGTHSTEYDNLNGRVTKNETDIKGLQDTVGTKPNSPTMDNSLWEEVADLRSDLGESNAAAGTGSAFARIKQAETNIGTSGDAANAAGSLYARVKQNVNDIDALETAVGSASDAASDTGSLYARVKDNDNLIAGLTTLLTWDSF